MGPSSTRQPGRHAATASVTFAAPFPAFGFDPGSIVICCRWGGVLDVHQRASLGTCSMPWIVLPSDSQANSMHMRELVAWGAGRKQNPGRPSHAGLSCAHPTRRVEKVLAIVPPNGIAEH